MNNIENYKILTAYTRTRFPTKYSKGVKFNPLLGVTFSFHTNFLASKTQNLPFNSKARKVKGLNTASWRALDSETFLI